MNSSSIVYLCFRFPIFEGKKILDDFIVIMQGPIQPRQGKDFVAEGTTKRRNIQII